MSTQKQVRDALQFTVSQFEFVSNLSENSRAANVLGPGELRNLMRRGIVVRDDDGDLTLTVVGRTLLKVIKSFSEE